MNLKLRKKMIYLSSITLLSVLGVTFFVNQARFGKLPSGERLERIKKSPNYRNGEFQNLSKTPVLAEDASYSQVMKGFFFSKNKSKKPEDSIPTKKTDLLKLSRDTNVLVWFGHSSYFLQIDGKRFLIDPIFSGNASPIRGTMPSFKGSDAYTVADIPDIDYLLITHDHWDHLDYETVMKLKPKVNQVITGLGNGSHFEYWGFDKEKIIEKDWYESEKLDSGFTITATPSRHFSGRLFKRNQTLWVSFVVQTPSMKVFIGGDGGYDTHFEEIGKRFGAFDLAILECGQYDKNWKYIHTLPEQIVKITKDLHAKRVLPVHWAKFKLANHNWNEPIQTLVNLSKENNISLVTPMIGEQVKLQDSIKFSAWWENVK